MTKDELDEYWLAFCEQTDEEYQDEYQFAQFLIERSDYT